LKNTKVILDAMVSVVVVCKINQLPLFVIEHDLFGGWKKSSTRKSGDEESRSTG
jgi:hypothetical protein